MFFRMLEATLFCSGHSRQSTVAADQVDHGGKPVKPNVLFLASFYPFQHLQDLLASQDCRGTGF